MFIICSIKFNKRFDGDQTSLDMIQQGWATLNKIQQDTTLSIEQTLFNEVVSAFGRHLKEAGFKCFIYQSPVMSTFYPMPYAHSRQS